VYIEGKITYKKYTDKNGIERVSTDIVCNTFRLMGKKEGNGQSNDDSFPTEEPKVGAKQTTNDNDIFGDYNEKAIPVEKLRYAVGQIFDVTNGKSTGKKLKIVTISESSVSFSFDSETNNHSLDKAAFEKYFDENIDSLPF
jgi:single-stranded DNA-binding protein